MTTITPEMKREIEDAGDGLPRVVDPETGTTYVLMKLEHYDELRAFLRPIARAYDDAEAMYPLIDEAFARNGWDDPKMSDYDDYEARRK